MDSLRYWAGEVGVDGFRFDLATTLARGRSSDQLPEGDFEHDGNFLACLMQDPLLATKKLIMEPWDVGPHGYRLGGFPPGTGEWNDRFRDSVRAFWRGDEAMLPAMADALAGSAHIFDHNRRSSSASINFIASHDGFTLHDVTAYEHKHNHANGEDNRDGHGHNLSANYGAEGETDDPAIRRLRQKQARNMAATLFLAQGVPMWLGGDELLRSQKGNNNAYCQDNPANWLSWDADQERQDFLAFVRKLVSLRRAHTLLTQDHFLHGKHEIGWLHPGGRTMTVEDWHNPGSHQIGLKLADDDHTLLILLNAGTRSCPFKLPAGTWRLLLATAERPIRTPLRTSIRIEERSLAILASRGPATGR
jgi:glycogen operon protein